MKYVLDTNVALKWFLAEPDFPKARQLRDDLQKGTHVFLAPDIFQTVIAQILTRAERQGRQEFNYHFHLQGQDGDRIAACFTPWGGRVYPAGEGSVRGGHDGLLALFRKDQVARPQKYPNLVAGGLRLAQAVRKALKVPCALARRPARPPSRAENQSERPCTWACEQ
jgi:hypothetical protein